MLQATHSRWLREQLPQLVAAGVLDADTAERLRAHYGAEAQGRGTRVVRVLLATLGAVFVGGGVVLLIAHDWDELGRGARTVLSLAPLLGAAAAAAWVVATRRGEAWRESIGGLWALAVAATLALVSQTYHLPGSFESYLRGCLLLAFPIAYLLDAATPALLYLLALSGWVLGAHASDLPLLYWPLRGLLAPFVAVRLLRAPEAASAEMLGWAVALSTATGIPAALTVLDDVLWGPLTLTGGVLLWALGMIAAGRRWGRPFRLVGALTALVVAFALSYSGSWSHQAVASANWRATAWAELGVVTAIVVVAVAVVAGAMRGVAADLVAPVGLGIPVAWLALLLARQIGEQTAAVVMNVYLLALGARLIVQGLRAERLRRANIGTAIVGLLILLRFFDQDWGFLVRGAAFIVVGLGFLLVNSVLLRRRVEA